MEKSGKPFTLSVYFKSENLPKYVRMHDKYCYEELSSIFESIDLLIVPSVWFETFGYTVSEALSYGVPVVVSSHVGAQDIIPKNAGVIYDSDSKEDLLNILKNMDSTILTKMNSAICDSYQVLTVSEMSKSINKYLYQK